MFAWLDWNQVANKFLGDCIAVMIGLCLAFLWVWVGERRRARLERRRGL